MIQSYRDRFSVQNKLSLALVAGALGLGQLSAQTLLLDVQPANAGGSVASTIADFQAFDSNAVDENAGDFGAIIKVVNTYGQLNGLELEDENANVYAVTAPNTGNLFQFNAGGTGSTYWSTDVPILEGYVFDNRDNPITNTVTIAGMEQYTPGDLITLTIFVMADNIGQDCKVTPTYNGTVLESKTGSYGESRTERINAVPALQWQFTAVDPVDSITGDGLVSLSFDWGAAGTDTAGLNGFMITGSAPDFGDVESVAAATEVNTVITGANPVQINATATFTGGPTDLPVSSLGITSYSVSPPTGVIEVSSQGLITPVGPGAATVTVTVNSGATSAMTDLPFTVEAISTLTAIPVSRYLLQNGVGTVINVTASSASLTDVRLNELSGLSIMTTDTGILDLSTVGFAQPNNMTGDVTLDVEFEGSTTTAQITVEAATSLTGSFIPDPNLVVNGFSASIDVFAQSANITDLRINDFPNLMLTYAVSSGTLGGLATVDVDGVVTPGGIEGNGAITVTLTNGPSVDVPFTVGQLAPKPTNLWHRYSFNGTNTVTQEEQDDPDNPGSTITVDVTNPTSTVVVDSVREANGELVGTGGLYNGVGNALALPGGPANGTGTYVNLPNGMISALPTATTFEVWSTNTAPTDWARIFDFGVSVQGEDVSGRGDDYFVLIPQAGIPGNPIAATYSLDQDTDQNPFLDSMLAVGIAERHYVVTYDSDEGIMNLYVDGSLVSTGAIPADRALSRLNDLNNWLGRAQWGDPRYTGILNEFRIYEGTMSASEVSASLAAGPDAAIDFTLPPSTDPIPVTDVSFNGSTFSLTFEAEIGSSYQVKVSDDLVSGFTNAPGTSLIVADEATETYTDTTATVDKRFYIVEPVPAP